MTNGGDIRRKAAAAAAVVAIASATLLAGPAAPAQAANACDKWGNSLPGSLTLGQARKATLCLLNEQRAKHGLARFKGSKKLRRAAQKHTERMQSSDCFAHQCPGEADPLTRLRRAGYIVGGLLRWTFAENIGWGERTSGTPRALMKAWMRSPGHRRNILDGGLRDVGVGFVQGSPYSKGANAGVYTTDFGFRAG